MKKILLLLLMGWLVAGPRALAAQGDFTVAKDTVAEEQNDDTGSVTQIQGQPEEGQAGSPAVTEEDQGTGGKNGENATQPQPEQAVNPKPIQDSKEILRTPKDESVITAPKEGPDGKPIEAQPVTTAPQGGEPATLMDNSRFTQEVHREDAHETQVNHYYWHTYSSYSYCHYYDPWGYNWYGWYDGPTYYWTRYYDDRYWWYDSRYDRWCYWYDDSWWWQDPHQIKVVYIYKDGHYYPAESDATPTPQATAQAPVPVLKTSNVIYSPDGTRVVKILGEDSDAFLYDLSHHPAFKPRYLASGVKEARFSSPAKGQPPQILLFFKDGTFQRFTTKGKPYSEPDKRRLSN